MLSALFTYIFDLIFQNYFARKISNQNLVNVFVPFTCVRHPVVTEIGILIYKQI